MLLIMISVMVLRVLKGVFSVREDFAVWSALLHFLPLAWLQKEKAKKGTQSKAVDLPTSHPQIDRARNAHQNDLENLVPFLSLGLLYVLCGLPAARLHFYVFTVFRFVHTICYLVVSVQPWRTFSHVIASLSLLSMSGRLIWHCLFES